MKHNCDIIAKSGLYGQAIGNVFEDDEGHFWVSSVQEDCGNQVNYCPQCGAKAPTPAEGPVEATDEA